MRWNLGRGGTVGVVLLAVAGLGWFLDWADRLKTAVDLIQQIPAGVEWLASARANIWLPPILIVVGLSLLWRDYRRRAPSTSKGSDLTALAEKDHAAIGSRIYYLEPPQGFNQFSAPEPYFDVKLMLVNASVFTLVASTLEGNVYFRSHPLQQAPRILSSTPAQIAHGEFCRILIRQYVQRETANLIDEDGEVSLGQMAIWFTYEHDGKTIEHRHAVGNEVSLRPIYIVLATVGQGHVEIS